MVYCGKASLGCQSCRKRRIKCDRIRPDCTQCVRIGKACPGYRDQLSLMFRDESTKVMQKAKAQWAGDEPEGSSSASAGPSEAALSTVSRRQSAITNKASTPHAAIQELVHGSPVISATVGPNLEEQATSFYINRYILGHPDEPRTIDQLSEIPWIWSPILNDAMVAVGLAGISNLKGDTEMMTTARARYGKALRQAGVLLGSDVAPSHEAMRLIVMLALFELVKGAFRTEGSVTTHVLGGTAMIKSWLPTPDTLLSTPKVTFSGLRSMIQMAYTTFIHAYMAGTTMPSAFHDVLKFSTGRQDPAEAPALELGVLITQFVDLAAYVKGHVLSDGRPAATATLNRMLLLDEGLAGWANNLPKTWHYSLVKGEDLPPDAVFEGEWHRYHDMWVARIWAHYRWARILLQQMILTLVDSCPTTSLLLVTASEAEERFDLIRHLCRETLASTPVFWRHPLLTEKHGVQVEHAGGGGSGAAGVPVLVMQLQTAACAPGIPASYWEWATNILECIWGDMGMIHAKSMRDAMITHREKLRTFSADSILTPVSPPR